MPRVSADQKHFASEDVLREATPKWTQMQRIFYRSIVVSWYVLPNYSDGSRNENTVIIIINCIKVIKK